MNLTVTSEKKVYTVAVSGRIDTLTAPSLEEKVREIENDADKLIIDMREVEYISSAGLRVIVAAHRTMLPKNGLVLRGLTKNVSTVINLTGFNKILNIDQLFSVFKVFSQDRPDLGFPVVADHEVDGVVLLHPLRIRFHITARGNDNRLPVLFFCTVQHLPALAVSDIRHCTGIDHIDICLFVERHFLVPFLKQDLTHYIQFIAVDLAAQIVKSSLFHMIQIFRLKSGLGFTVQTAS